MRKISPGQVIAFLCMLLPALALAALITSVILPTRVLGDLRGPLLIVVWAALAFAFVLIAYRIFLRAFPLEIGEIAAGSRLESIYHVYLLFYLIVFYPVMRSGAVPVPLMRLVYLGLGARLGANTYSSGIILDPGFVEIGDNSIIGQYALLVPHVIESDRLAHYPIRIGSNVTVGAHAVVLSDVTIGDGAIVATGAIVPKGTSIAPGEVWGGVPARRIGR